LPPTMHIMLGVGNNLLDDCRKYIDSLSRLENLPKIVRQAWQQYYDLLAIETESKEEMDVWVECFGSDFVSLQEPQSAVINLINSDRRMRPLAPGTMRNATDSQDYTKKGLLNWLMTIRQ